MSIDLSAMTRKEFESVPMLEFSSAGSVTFHYMVILPTKVLHASGFCCMDFVLCTRDSIIGRVGGADQVALGGVTMAFQNLCKSDAVGWSFDCLPTSGLLRIFAPYSELTCSPPLSTFEVFAHIMPTKDLTEDDESILT